MKIKVYGRGILPDDRALIERMTTAVGITSYEIVDLNTSTPPDEGDKHLAVAFGKTTARLASKYTKDVYTLPTLDKLLPKEENAKYRSEAWKTLKQVKECSTVSEVAASPDTRNWEYAIMTISNRKVCIYEGEKPKLQSVDCYLSRDDCRLILAIKEAFKAETVVLDKEN